MAAEDPFVGRKILEGRFQILERIGTGGMGSVYKATEIATSRPVALKILHRRLTARKDLAARFRREARALEHLKHPNTVKVLSYGELEDGILYIVMEYLRGRNLHQVVRAEGPLAPERAVRIMVQACAAIDEAHA
jgi:serine/threonine-protein kinase